jgi:hypothetical protein
MDSWQETVDHVALGRLLSAYADVVTRRAWTELIPLFEPDAQVRVDTVTAPARDFVGPEQLGAFIGSAIEVFSFFELVVFNVRTELATDGDPDAAKGRVLIGEIRQHADGSGWSHTYGVYHDRYRRHGDGWRFARRDYQSLARTGSPDSFPFPSGFELA